MRKTRPALILLAAAVCLALGVVSRSRSAPRAKATVLLFLSTDCPISARYTSRINALYDQYSAQGVQFEALFPNDLETQPSIRVYMAERNYRFPFAIDLGAQRAKKLRVKTVPTAVVLNARGNVAYEGAIDDNPDVTAAQHRYLFDAIAAELSDSEPIVKKTEGKGCVLMPSSTPPATGAVNYATHVMPILENHCIQCHRPGEVAPFSLVGYANAKKWAPMIANVTGNRQMPPWKAIHGYGEFAFDNSLSETEIETLHRWSEAGATKGRLETDVTAPPPPTSEWRLGKPDMVLALDQPFKVGADGPDVYRNFVFRTHFNEPMYVSAMDLKPGNRKIVHHAILFVDKSGYSSKLEQKQDDGQAGYTTSGGGPGFFPDTSFGGWVPGSTVRPLPPDLGYLLKPGANLVLQVHYHRDGKPEEDLTKVALYFTKGKPREILTLTWLVNPGIRIPAGDASHAEHIAYTLPWDTTIYGAMPHMHLLGRSMKATLQYPDGTTQPLIYVNDWDFNWQISYVLKQPLEVPKGTKISIDAVYDNSPTNSRNPNRPPRDVSWGEQTTDEMMVLVLANTVHKGNMAVLKP